MWCIVWPEKHSCLTVCLKLDAYWGYTIGLGKDQEFLSAGSERWDAAAADKQGRENYKSPGGAPPPATNNQVLCSNCNIAGHFVARCPTIRCERCKILGHISQICQTALPWECIAPMCGF
jgi:hypothetical protein